MKNSSVIHWDTEDEGCRLRRALGGSNLMASRVALQRHAAMHVSTCYPQWGMGCSGREAVTFLHCIC